MRARARTTIVVGALAVAMLAGCHQRWQIAACTANEQGQCARYAQHGHEQRVERGALPQVFTARFTECADGFARVDFEEQPGDVVLVRATCRVPDPTSGGGVTIPDAAAPTDATANGGS